MKTRAILDLSLNRKRWPFFKRILRKGVGKMDMPTLRSGGVLNCLPSALTTLLCLQLLDSVMTFYE